MIFKHVTATKACSRCGCMHVPHTWHGAHIQVQIRAADGCASHSQDHILRICDDGHRPLLHLDGVLAMPLSSKVLLVVIML